MEELLNAWEEKVGDEATVEKMIEVLTHMGKKKIAQRICRECYD